MSQEPKRSPFVPVRYLVLAWLCLAATIAYVHRGAIAVPTEEVRADLHLSRDEMGWVMTSFYLGYAFFQLPGGWLGNVWGTRRALSLFALVWSSATGLMGLAGGMHALVVFQFLNGVAQAGAFPCCVQSIAQWFPSTRRALPSGLLASFMSIGLMIANWLTAQWLLIMTWNQIFVLMSIPGFLWVAGFYWWFRDRPEEHSWVDEEELAEIREGVPQTAPARRPATPWGQIAGSVAMWFICAQQFFRAAGYIFYATWFPTFLRDRHAVSLADLGNLSALPPVGMVLGAALGGFCSDWIQRRTGSRRLSRQGWAIFNMVSCAGCILAAHFVETALPAVIILSVGTFFAGMGGPAGYSITIDLGGRHVSTIFSIMNMAGNIGAALCPTVVSQFVNLTGSWDLALLLFVGIYLAAAACWAMLDPTQPIVKDDNGELGT